MILCPGLSLIGPSPQSSQTSTQDPPVSISAQRRGHHPSPLGREGSTETSVGTPGSPAPLPDPSPWSLTAHRLPARGGRRGPGGPGALGRTCRARRGARVSRWQRASSGRRSHPETPGVGVSARACTAPAASGGGLRPPGGVESGCGVQLPAALRRCSLWPKRAGTRSATGGLSLRRLEQSNFLFTPPSPLM